jgi:hypothetical protein
MASSYLPTSLSAATALGRRNYVIPPSVVAAESENVIAGLLANNRPETVGPWSAVAACDNNNHDDDYDGHAGQSHAVDLPPLNGFRIVEDDEVSLVGDCEEGDPDSFRYHFGTAYDDDGQLVWYWWTVDDSNFVHQLNRSRYYRKPVAVIPDHVHGPYISKEVMDKYIDAAKYTMVVRRAGNDRALFAQHAKRAVAEAYGGACCATSNVPNVMADIIDGYHYVHLMCAWPLGPQGAKDKESMRAGASRIICKWSRDVGTFNPRGFTHPVYSANHYCTANATKSACTGVTVATFALPVTTLVEAERIASALLDRI